MQLKETILKFLDSLGPEGQALKAPVESETDTQRIYLMYQVIREVCLKEYAGRDIAPFQVKTSDGNVVLVKNIEEFLKLTP